MTYEVRIREVPEQPLAVVRTPGVNHKTLHKTIGEVLKASEVYKLLRSTGVSEHGLNVFMYWDEGEKCLLSTDAGMVFEIGVQVGGPIKGTDKVVPSATPAGRVAAAMHVGPYNKLGEAHSAVRKWCKDNHHEIAGPNWEIYGHHNDDASKLETEVLYLLK